MLVKRFLVEVTHFSRNNWWVYVIYTILLAVVYLTNKDRLISVVLISLLHFIADIFIMMMFSAYNRRSYPQGTYFQIISMLLFLSIKIYTGFVGGGWHYLAADPIYILAAIKNYRKDVKKHVIPFINRNSMFLLSLLIILLLVYLQVHLKINIFAFPPEWVQTLCIFLFAIALATRPGKQQYELSLIALSIMVLGSAWESYDAIRDGRLTGLALSYALLPLTVLVFYTKHWSEYE